MSEKEPTVKQTPRKPSLKKVTIPGLLDHISPEELEEFVRDYARQNRAFALALKARFTAALPVDNKREKYLELLETTIKGVRTKNDQVSFRGAQQLAQMTRELLGQARDSIARNALNEAVVLLTSILEKIGPVSRKVKAKDPVLDDVLQTCFRQLREIQDLHPAPGLLSELWDFAMRESRKQLFRHSSLRSEYHELLLKLAPQLGKTTELIRHFQTQLEELPVTDPARKDLLLYIYKLLALEGNLEAQQDHLLTHLQEPGLVLFAVEEALSSGHWKKARFLAEKGLESSQDPSQSGKLVEHLLQLALREKDRDAILHFASSRFLDTRKSEYLDHLRQFAGADWPSIADELLTELEGQTWSTAKRDAIAQILQLDERFDHLADYILRLQSLDLLQRYGPSWPDDRVVQVENLYMEVLQKYLANHLGRKPSQRVREVIEQLLDTGKGPLADRLLQRFRQEFSSRQSLMEELETLRA